MAGLRTDTSPSDSVLFEDKFAGLKKRRIVFYVDGRTDVLE
jgi:hypothetical protein